jgi:glycosyltransferase involved in cell wall biosynthesis
MAPKVSILIPVYNRKNYIAQCIKSALDQTFIDFEIVIVDNASEDGTWEMCMKFAAEDSRIKIFRNQENIGPVKNWIRCIEEAAGEFGKILFSDDLIFPEYLENTISYLEDQDVSFVVTNIKHGSSLHDCREINYTKNTRLIHKDEYFNLLLNGEVPYSPGAALLELMI